MPPIRFSTELFNIGTWTILHLPKAASVKLPSRGMVMVEGTMNGSPLRTVMEPDGKGSHWFRINKAMGVAAGDTVKLEIESTKEWIEPSIPADLKKALAGAPEPQELWKNITPMAHWDWIRWIGSTKNPETRKKRIDVAMSKLSSGMRRPCCFNRSMCCEPEVSNGGVLLAPGV